MKHKITLIPGDGIGPEVTAPAVELMGRAGAAAGFDLVMEEASMGGSAIDAYGVPLPDATLAAALALRNRGPPEALPAQWSR